MTGTLRVTHRFMDSFKNIASEGAARKFVSGSKRQRLDWANRQNSLMLEDSGNTGRRLRAWLKKEGVNCDPGMTLDNFDLIMNLVALGMA